MLYGRDDARKRVDTLLTLVRTEGSGALVVTGPPGIGKSALLDYAADAAQELQVLRARGIPAESEIPYAGLSQLLAPLLPLIPALTAAQAAAVESALAISPPSGGDAYPVLAGTLGLLAAAAARTPVVVIVDDGQWLDAASVDALLFAQRRLGRDPIAFLCAVRPDPDVPPAWKALPALELDGLDFTAASELTAARGGRLDDGVLRWLVQATGGNPLALVDLPKYVQPDQLSVLALRSEPAPVGPALTTAYGHAVADMPPDARQAVLIAATLDDTSVGVLQRALRSAGLPMSALEPAEDAGLLKLVNGGVQIRHPLVRSAVIQGATAGARRAAHLAAAEGLRASRRPADNDSRVWHLADAAMGTDEAVAELLEELAVVATARTGYSAASMTYRKAAELSEAGAGKVRRLLAAAEAAATAGLPEQSLRVLGQLDAEAIDAEAIDASAIEAERTAAAIEYLKGRLRTWAGDPPGAARQLLDRAERIRDVDPLLAGQMAMEAAVAAVLAGRMEWAADASKLLTGIGPALGPDAPPIVELLDGSIQAMRGAGEDAREILHRCAPGFDVPHPSTELVQQQVYLATEFSVVNATQAARSLFERAITIARERGAIGILPFALAMSAANEYRMGAWDSAYSQATEAETLANDTGRSTDRPNALLALAMVDAARGREPARDHALTVIRETSAMGASLLEAQGYSALGLLELSSGDPSAAIAPLRRCGQLSLEFGLFELGHLQWAAELVEAKVRSGQSATTIGIMRIMRGAAHPRATSLNRGMLARCEGMLAVDDAWDDHFQHALSLLSGSDSRPFELARTHLCFGERLRRHRRRKDAREHLSAAWESFANLGAATWAERASREIQATGTTAPGSIAHPTDLLTPQEFQVAMTVAAGATNREAAHALFLSQKTVEFHLSAIYRRLGLRSRGELAKLMAERRRP